jgi:hypothetical protein
MYQSEVTDSVPEPKESMLREELGPKDLSRSRQYWLRENHINIRFLSIGCVIDIGCKSIPFTSVDEAMKELNAYIANPQAESKKWLKILD